MSDLNRTVAEVVCVCCWRDADTWQKGAGYIVKNIRAARYTLVVPDAELDDFKGITPAPFKVVAESQHVSVIAHYLSEKIPAEFSKRKGWYLQQFIKMTAVLQAADDEVVLIWDADTVPLKQLDFFSESGKIRYYLGQEHHQPYFALIRKLLGLEKEVSFSFIAQCFPLKKKWLSELCSELEQRYHVPWYQAIIDKIDFSEPSGFSEYETMGTFIHHRHRDEIEAYAKPWWRYGNKLVGDIAWLTPRKAAKLARQYDFISFEKWERRSRLSTLAKRIAAFFSG